MTLDTSNEYIQKAEAAGFYYPKTQEKLNALLDKYLAEASQTKFFSDFCHKPFGLIVPDQSYKESAQISAYAYNQLIKHKNNYHRVVILSTGRFKYFRGVAYYFSDYYETPLGRQKIAVNLRKELLIKQYIINVEPSFNKEYSHEVQIPFITKIFGEDMQILPLLLGGNSKAEIITDIIAHCDDGKTLFIFSHDLSLYLEQSERLGQSKLEAIIAKDYKTLQHKNIKEAGIIVGLTKYLAEQKKHYKIYPFTALEEIAKYSSFIIA